MGKTQPASFHKRAPEPGVWYECTAADRKIRVHFSPEIIRYLQREAVAALRGEPGTGREIGGILLGAAGPEEEGEALRVERAEMVPCEHRQGPSYVLAAEECAGFEAAVRAEHAANRKVIGYFRSQIRPDLQLYDEDMALLDTCFVEPARLVLLLKPLESGLCTAGLFFRREDGLRPDFCDLEVPFFDPNATAVAIVPPPAPRPRQPEPLPAAPPAPTLPPPAAPSPWLRRVLTAAVFMIVAVFAVILAAFWAPYVVQRWRSLAPPAAPATASVTPQQRLDLQVTDRPDHLIVTWNREAPVLKTARRGILEIQDGRERKELALDTGELTGGSLMYLPATGDVLFRLEIFVDDTHTMAESVRFLSGRAGMDTSGSILLSQTERAVVPAKPTAPVVNRAPVPAPRRWEAPATPAAPAVQNAMPPPPRLAESTSTASAPVVPAQTPAPPPANHATAAAAPARVPAAPAAAPRIANYQPPVVLAQAPVFLSPNVRTMVNGNASVEVRVSLDVRGRVTKAELVSGNGAVAHLLGVSALDAARRYRFAPARLDGTPTPSEMVITFRFAR